MTKKISPESEHLNEVLEYGKHRATEVLEHVDQELSEFEYNEEERYMYWRGFWERMKSC